MLVHISSVVKNELTEGKYGQQRRIAFKDETGKIISGWVPLTQFKPEDWQAGKTVDVEVTQNGTYFNFKLIGKAQKAVAQAVSQANTEVMDALRKIYAKLIEMDKKIEDLDRMPFPATETAKDVFGAKETPDVGDGIEF